MSQKCPECEDRELDNTKNSPEQGQELSPKAIDRRKKMRPKYVIAIVIIITIVLAVLGLFAFNRYNEWIKLKNKTTYIVNGVELEMVFCPAGSFTMGSPTNEPGRWDNEEQHKVTLTKPFLIGKYEVTQRQYRAVIGKNPSHFKGDDRPVEQVSWNDAMEFCDELNALTEGQRPAGYKFTLPTEAQWEYACRAGTTTGLNNDREVRQLEGEDVALNKVGWYGANSGGETHSVGQKQPNKWGIYDMHGNVWEWCLDWYESYSGNAVDPVGPSSGSGRVSRGGGWGRSARDCRSASRNHDSPGSSSGNRGFRVVLAPEQ